MNYMYHETKRRILGNSLEAVMDFFKPGAYWRLPQGTEGSGPIWVLKVEGDVAFDEANQRAEGYRSFASRSDMASYCALVGIELGRWINRAYQNNG